MNTADLLALATIDGLNAMLDATQAERPATVRLVEVTRDVEIADMSETRVEMWDVVADHRAIGTARAWLIIAGTSVKVDVVNGRILLGQAGRRALGGGQCRADLVT